MFAGEFATKGFAHIVDVGVVEAAGGFGEVDMFEHAQGMLWQTDQDFGVHTVFIDGD